MTNTIDPNAREIGAVEFAEQTVQRARRGQSFDVLLNALKKTHPEIDPNELPGIAAKLSNPHLSDPKIGRLQQVLIRTAGLQKELAKFHAEFSGIVDLDGPNYHQAV